MSRVQKILCLLMLCCALNYVADVPVLVETACAATNAQKAKEAAKKKKAKEAAKKKKQQQKAAAKKKKAAQKKQAASGSRKPAATAQKVDEETAYQMKVAEIDKQNKKVAAYMTRDIAHRVGFWGQAGYSAMFPHHIDYTQAADPLNAYGFQAKAMGFVGGGAGIGYQLRYKRMLFTTGAEYQFYSSKTKIYDGENDYLDRTYGLAPYEQTMVYNYRFSGMRDQLKGGFVQIPVLFGGEFDKVFFLAGPKVGIGVQGSSTVGSRMTTSAIDRTLYTDLTDLQTHTLVSDYACEPVSTKTQWGLNVAMAAEVGICLDQFLQPKKKDAKSKKPTGEWRYRLSMFAEYGVLNINSANNYAPAQIGENDMPVNLLQEPANPLNAPLISSLATTAAQQATINPFMIGVKLAVYYELPRKQKKMANYPAAPSPRLTFVVTDEETHNRIAGAALSIQNTEKGRVQNKNVNSMGEMVLRLPKAEYGVMAKKVGYYDTDTLLTDHRKDKDTLFIQMRRQPIPVPPTMAGYVLDLATGAKLDDATVLVASAETKQDLLETETATDGRFVTDLTAGSYKIRVNRNGYMPISKTVQFQGDTIRLRMKPIEEGTTVKIENLFFATAKTNILPESEESLQELATFLQANPQVRIMIVGHTDNVGKDEANMKLSAGRAKAVKNELIMRGINADRIETDGKGETEPVADNETEEGRALNRRVEFTIL